VVVVDGVPVTRCSERKLRSIGISGTGDVRGRQDRHNPVGS